MTLYRINYTGDTKLNRYTEMLIENGQLAEVEPCVHGNYDTHWPVDKFPWAATVGGNPCHGAGIGDTE